VRSALTTTLLTAALLLSPLGATAMASEDKAPASDANTLLPVTGSPNAAPGDSEIKTRLGSAGTLTVAGETLHAAVLRRFYAGHDNQPVWATHPAQATALWHAVLNAGDQGLDPDSFHVAAFAKTATSPIDRDLLLSDAFLSYAEALARGAVPSEMRTEDEDLAADPVDVVAVLDTTLTSPNPEQTIEALAPNTPAYAALRHAYETYRAMVKAGGWPHVPETQTADRTRVLQNRLAIEGFLPAGYSTNVFDEQTTQALKKFQQRHGFEGDGKLGNATLVELRSRSISSVCAGCPAKSLSTVSGLIPRTRSCSCSATTSRYSPRASWLVKPTSKPRSFRPTSSACSTTRLGIFLMGSPRRRSCRSSRPTRAISTSTT